MKEYAPKILIIEEEPEMLAVYCREFVAAGFEVHHTQSLSKARHHLENNYVNAVFLEVDKKAKPSISFVKELLSKENKNVSKVFVLSDLPYPGFINKSTEHPVLNILTKPLIMRDLVNAVRLRTFVNTYKIHYRDGVNDLIKESMEEVLDFYLEGKMSFLPATKKIDHDLGGEVAVILPMSSDTILGSLVLVSKRGYVDIMSAAMLGDEEVEEISKEEAADVLSEVCNQVAGIVKEKMKDIGFPLSIGLPKSLVGKGLRMVHPGINDVGVVPIRIGEKTLRDKLPFLTEKGGLSIEFCFDPLELDE